MPGTDAMRPMLPAPAGAAAAPAPTDCRRAAAGASTAQSNPGTAANPMPDPDSIPDAIWTARQQRRAALLMVMSSDAALTRQYLEQQNARSAVAKISDETLQAWALASAQHPK